VNAIEARDVFRLHGGGGAECVVALQGLTLTVRHGEVVVVLGPSGSGKSTLLRILAGLERPSAGTVRVFGDDFGAVPRRRLDLFRSRELGYVDQHYVRALAPELEARELVGLQLGLTGVDARERTRRVDELLERVGLGDRARSRPAELSGGEQQRVAIARAMACAPPILLGDEPTGNLDTVLAREMFELLKGLNAAGTTVVYVTHDQALAGLASRIASVRDGLIVGDTGR
jgi:putative ABC transport system ATP-binding protein